MSDVKHYPNDQTDKLTRQDDLFGQWLSNRAANFLERSGVGLDAEIAEGEQSDELAMKIAGAPTTDPHRIVRKVQILEQRLMDLEVGGHVEHALLAGIKADILRLDRS